ncbi:MAG: hypothetical protein CBD26_03015 [Candidatus Pelagibacter sp. TMED166]|nr:MAG: hypothetical protein CBD26_03015 [Candidatus Pelagibacter sp. TMED166]|tara:strand:+ start:28396 stop:29655 length:1260 start_codon:yes stop_codon:yes gene_type:complete
MNDFSNFERETSKFIKRFPYFHKLIKYIYQYINYILKRDKNFSYTIHRNAVITNISNESLFYGYYDHSPFSNDMNHFISHSFNNSLFLNLYKFKNEKLIKEASITETDYFNFQQGIRPIWLDSKNIIFNYVDNKFFKSGIYNIDNKLTTSIKYPVQEVSPDGEIIFSINYYHLDKINRDYGYNINERLKFEHINGIIGYRHKIDKILFNLKSEHIFNHSQNKHNFKLEDCEINHLHHCPYTDSILFIFRNIKSNGFSELFKYDYVNKKIYLIYSGKLMSHYCWIDKNKIFAYLEHNDENGFFELSFNNQIHITQELLPNKKDNLNDGHPSLSPNEKWIVYDSYPNKARKSCLYIIENKINAKKILIGTFYSPMKYYGYKRCDLHPRWSPDGKFISLDSAHEGKRKTYLINVSQILKKYE